MGPNMAMKVIMFVVLPVILFSGKCWAYYTCNWHSGEMHLYHLYITATGPPTDFNPCAVKVIPCATEFLWPVG